MGFKKVQGRKKPEALTWTDELAEELHKPAIKKFQKRRVYVRGIDEIWTADLVDMQSFSKHNGGIKYLLTVIDVFSKYGWMRPLKRKTGQEVAAAFKSIFKLGRKPKKLWVDKATEFYNKDVRSILGETTMYSTENEEKSFVVERWNRTMKEKMYKYFSANATWKYVDVIDKIVEKYNNTRHSSIKVKPVQASLKKNEAAVWSNLYGNEQQATTFSSKFSVGDRVRITKKNIFEKGYTPRWTEEVFTISNIQYTEPPTYKIADLNGEEIRGSFYEQELQKTNQEIYRIEKIITKRANRSLVKWLGYPELFNSWVDNKDLIKLQKQR